jgi:hypothetical protein
MKSRNIYVYILASRIGGKPQSTGSSASADDDNALYAK